MRRLTCWPLVVSTWLLLACGGAEATPSTTTQTNVAPTSTEATLHLRIRGSRGPLGGRVGLFRGTTSLLTARVGGEVDILTGVGVAPVTPSAGATDWRTRRQDFVPGPLEEYVYVGSESSFVVEPGPLRLVVTRGVFRAPEVREVELRPGQELQVDVELGDAIDTTGWRCADMHLHVGRFDDANDEDLGFLVAAEELDLAVFVDWAGRATGDRSPHWGGWAWTEAELAQRLEAPFFAAQAWGRPDRACALHAFGHDTPVSGLSKHSQATIITAANAEGALVAGALGRIFVEGALLGEVHASEVLSLGQWKGLEGWYDVLNVGAHVAAIAGTDSQLGSAPQLIVDYHSPIGANRVCARTEQPGRDDFLAAVRGGHTFVTNGPRLGLRIEGAGLGDTRELEGPEDITLSVELEAPTVPGGVLVLLQNGVVIDERAADAAQLRYEVVRDVGRSSWFALQLRGERRVPGGDVPMAHTSPLWVEVSGAPVFETESAARVGEAIAEAEDIRESGQSNAVEREASLRWAERARAVLAERRAAR